MMCKLKLRVRFSHRGVKEKMGSLIHVVAVVGEQDPMTLGWKLYYPFEFILMIKVLICRLNF